MNRPGGGGRAEGGVQWLKALVLIAVLVIIGVVILAKTVTSSKASSSTSHHSTSSLTTASSVPAPSTTTTLLPAGQVKVQVLNGLKTGSLASLWSAKLKTKFGYATALPDDTTVKTTVSAIYVLTPGYQGEAAQLATQVGLTAAAVNPTVPAPATAPIPATERNTANLVLVIGQDLAGTA
jgi:hypothetical protein